eukprot:159662-Pleurochrysis_carterae.AAC.1
MDLRQIEILPGSWRSFTGINLRMIDVTQYTGDIPGSPKVVPACQEETTSLCLRPLLRPYGKSPLDTRKRFIPVIIAPGKTKDRYFSLRGPGNR